MSPRRGPARRSASDDERFALALRQAGERIPASRALAVGWDPLSALYHFGTKDVEWLHGAADEAFEAAQRKRARTDPPPPPFKRTRGQGTLLEIPEYTGQFPDVLLSRRTWRGFGTRPIRNAELGALLDLSFGAQMAGRPLTGGRVLFKTSPSGGACHPTEAYVLALRVEDLPRGLYHYSPRTSRLHLIRKGATSRQVVGYLAGQHWFASAAAVVLMTAVLPRLWYRYAQPRAYRAVLLEAGHVCQTFCLVATWLDLAPFCTMALDDTRIEADLKVDGVSEVVLYAAGVGSKPADGRWVQWPGHRPVPKRSRARRGR